MEVIREYADRLEDMYAVNSKCEKARNAYYNAYRRKHSKPAQLEAKRTKWIAWLGVLQIKFDELVKWCADNGRPTPAKPSGLEQR
jgi:hypothetical protein